MAASFGEVFRQSDEQHRETPFPTLPEGTGPIWHPPALSSPRVTLLHFGSFALADTKLASVSGFWRSVNRP